MARSSDGGEEHSGARDRYTGTLWTEVVGGAVSADAARREAAWARFVDQYRLPIESTLRARLRVPALRAHTADLVDEFFSYLVLHRVLEKADRSIGPFRRYLQRVVKYFALGVAREQGRWTTAEEAALAALAHVGDDVEAADEREWFVGVVQAALEVIARANPRQAMALRLRYGVDPGANGAEMMPPAIAERLGSTPHAVHELLRRGKKALRLVLARVVADTVYAASAETYHDDFAVERARLEARVGEVWPGLLSEDAGD